MSDICKNWSTWLKKTRFSYMDENQKQQTLNWLLLVRDQVLNLAQIKDGQKVADFGCGSGLLGFGVLEKFEDKVEIIFSDKFSDCLEECRKILETTKCKSNVKFLQTDIEKINLQNSYLDCALTRSVLVHVLNKKAAFFELQRVLKSGGRYCAFEPIISQNTRYYELLSPQNISSYEEFKKAEKEFMESPDDSLVNFNANTLDEDLNEAGFSDVKIDVQKANSRYVVKKENVISWFVSPPAPDKKSMKERFLDYFEEKKVDNFIKEVELALGDKEIEVSSNVALIKAVK